MKRDAVIRLALIVTGLVGLSSACWAEDTDVGKFEYQASCAGSRSPWMQSSELPR